MLAEIANYGVVRDDVGAGASGPHPVHDAGGVVEIAGAAIAVDDGVEGEDVRRAAEGRESRGGEALGGAGAAELGEEGDGGVEGGGMGAEAAGGEVGEDFEGEVADGGVYKAVEADVAVDRGGKAGGPSQPGEEL